MTRERAFEIIANLNEEIIELKDKIKELERSNNLWTDISIEYRKQIEAFNKTNENNPKVPEPII